MFGAIGSSVLALNPSRPAAPTAAGGNARNPLGGGGTRQNLMGGGGGGGGGGLFRDLQQFNNPNPHGDFGGPTAAARAPPVVVVPPSEESIEALMVSFSSVGLSMLTFSFLYVTLRR